MLVEAMALSDAEWQAMDERGNLPDGWEYRKAVA